MLQAARTAEPLGLRAEFTRTHLVRQPLFQGDPAHELGDHSYFGYLMVDDAEAYFTLVTQNGADIIKPLRDEPWGMREFALRTIDGQRIMIGQDITRDVLARQRCLNS